MKQILLFTVMFSVLSSELPADLEREVLTSSEISELNSNFRGWSASENEFTRMSIRSALSMFKAPEGSPRALKLAEAPSLNAVLPVKFDASVFWPSCVVPVGSQGGCSASYAFATAAVLSERLCITNPSVYTGMNFSAQYQMACGVSTTKCSGGFIIDAWSDLMNVGTGVASCQPWTGSSSCSNVCANGTPVTIYRPLQGSLVSLVGADQIQQAIYSNGAVSSPMTVYQDFLSYQQGVYYKVYGGIVGAQSVKIFGWGNNGTTNYWICANSIGTNWGVQGLFWIAFGQCGIDNMAYYATIILN
jgi:cathepsin B